MQIQAAEVKIDRAYDSLTPVGHALLRVDEPRRVLINAHTALCQRGVIAARHREDHLFVGDAGRDDPHVDAAGGGQRQGALHLVAQNQIGRRDVDILPCTADEVQVDILADRQIIQRVVGIGHDQPALPRSVVDGGQVRLNFDRLLLRRAPQFEENQRQAAHGVALQPDAGVLPLAVGVGAVEVLLGEVVTAREADAAIHDGDLAVVAVIHEDVQNRDDRVEHPALDAPRFQLFDKGAADKPNAAYVVVEHTHLDAVGGALGQNVLNLLPCRSVLDGVIFHKNEFFGAVQCNFLRLQRLAGVAVEGHVGVGVGRVTGAGEILRMIFRRAAGTGQGSGLFQRRGMAGAQPGKILVKTLANAAHRAGAAKQKVDRQPEHRENQNQDDPRNFIRRVDMQPIYTQRNHKRQHRRRHRDGGGVVVQPQRQPAQPQHLQQHADAGNQHPADTVGDSFAFFFGRIHAVYRLFL